MAECAKYLFTFRGKSGQQKDGLEANGLLQIRKYLYEIVSQRREIFSEMEMKRCNFLKFIFGNQVIYH